MLMSSMSLFGFCMILGTFISLSSPYWILMWVGMEVSLIGLIPIILADGSYLSKEGAVKYFTVQAIGSILILLGSNLGFFPSFSWEVSMLTSPSLAPFIMIMGLFMKLGVFPFYVWVPSVISSLSWNSCLLILTWQKIAPLFLMGYLVQNLSLPFMGTVMGLIVSSSIMGALGGISQTSIRSILSYSSITHTGWMVFATFIGVFETLAYFCIYSTLTLSLFWAFKLLESNHKLSHSFSLNNLIAINLFSLSGMPPFLGFCGKWLILTGSITLMFSPLFIMVLISSSVISLFFYLKLMYSHILVEKKLEEEFITWIAPFFGLLNIMSFLMFLTL